ncbi:hypothetical protein K402DRAFT_454438 [Aulographum hederae CBS 113979]|uniref:Uncharacterized protein n=1 Tax=Aulographum hederae CBS 113979 TaxID=1176131 RepID=A0A6G1H0H4_9PEZI|nr:hypothetical protein K402DRAFT_454438 [Aulographum hederae CBS 113979]
MSSSKQPKPGNVSAVPPPKHPQGRQRYAPGQYLDGVQFWQEQCERVSLQNADLQARIAELQRQNEKLKAKAIGGAETAASTSKKRKLDPSSVGEKANKRGKAAANVDLEDEESFSKSFDTLGMGKESTNTLRQLYRIKLHCVSSNIDDSSLSGDLIQAAGSLATLVENVYLQHQEKRLGIKFVNPPKTSRDGKKLASSVRSFPQLPPEMDDQEISAFSLAAARSIILLYHGLAKLAERRSDTDVVKERCVGAVVYAYVQMFSQLLSTLAELCRRMAKYEATAGSRANADTTQGIAVARGKTAKKAATAVMKRKATRQSVRFAEPSGSLKSLQTKDEPLILLDTKGRPDLPRRLSSLLSGLISTLSPNMPPHHDLFEGMLHLLLDRVGKTLHFCVFGCERIDDIQAQILAGGTLGNIEVQDSQKESEDQEKKAAAEIEGKALMSVVEKAIFISEGDLGNKRTPLPSAQESSTTPAKSKSNSNSSKVVSSNKNENEKESSKSQSKSNEIDLAEHAKRKLQDTLIKCVFGPTPPLPSRVSEGSLHNRGGHNVIATVLKMPPKILLPDVGRNVEDEGDEAKGRADWVEGKVWELVGWDVLGGLPVESDPMDESTEDEL